MSIFWNTIAAYNSGTWVVQLILVSVGALLTVLLYHRPSHRVRLAMKLFMIFLNLWIAGAYYMVYGEPRPYHEMMAMLWVIMGGIWVYDLTAGEASLQNNAHHNRFALILLLMPLIYPLCSLLLGRNFPAITSPVMPCSVAVFTLGLMLAFSQRVNIVLAMFLCHWALVGLAKTYFYGIPEDYLLGVSVIPCLYLLFKEYIAHHASAKSKPSAKVLTTLLVVVCLGITLLFSYTLYCQFNLFSQISL